MEKTYQEKIKLIYCDPPYNTGGSSDIFSYNNNFKHSTWLTFMKNRLEISKRLLRKDGFIAITIDHVELFYLGALADEIFGQENRVGIVTIFINPKGRQHERYFSASTEYMLVYAKDVKEAEFQSVTIDEKKRYSLTDPKVNCGPLDLYVSIYFKLHQFADGSKHSTTNLLKLKIIRNLRY